MAQVGSSSTCIAKFYKNLQKYVHSLIWDRPRAHETSQNYFTLIYSD